MSYADKPRLYKNDRYEGNKRSKCFGCQAGDFHLGNFSQVNLNANRPGYHALHINENLKNAWGLSASPGGTFWISAADGGVSYIYNGLGVQPIPPVAIPSHIKGMPGNPTGQIFNGTPDFIITQNGKPAVFLFASEDGTITGWNGGTSAFALKTVQTRVQDIQAWLWQMMAALTFYMQPILQSTR
jgi:uncharacterized protein (TIGR03118 family)